MQHVFPMGYCANNLNPAAKVGAGTMNFIHQVKANSRIGFLKGYPIEYTRTMAAKCT